MEGGREEREEGKEGRKVRERRVGGRKGGEEVR